MTFKAGGEEAELREEQDMVKDSTIGIICNLIGHKYRVSTRSRDLSPRSSIGLAISKLYDDGDIKKSKN